MGVVLWHGTISARRHDVACPRCLGPAAFDCDTLGRTIVVCVCSPGPFLMPVSIGATVDNAWPVFIPDYPREPKDGPDTRIRGNVDRTPQRICPSKYDRRCECGRALAPRNLFCRHCSPVKREAAESTPCKTDGCPNCGGFKSPYCADCRAEHRRQYHRDRAELARAARGGVDRRRTCGSKGAASDLSR